MNRDTLELEEYRALRALLGRRGSLRAVIVLVTMGMWAAAAALVAGLVPMPLAALLPLVVLAGGFETGYALHVGAERIGRYLYVRYESGIAAASAGPANAALPLWETAIAAFGSGRLPFGGRPSGALFVLLFGAATLVNLALAALGATPPELAALAAIHAVFVARVIAAQAASKNQRREDQEEFERILTM